MTLREWSAKGRTGLAAGLAALLIGLTGVTAAAARDFENPLSEDPSQQFASANPQREDTPDDPAYDRAEPDDEDGVSSSNLYDESYGFFGFPSSHSRASAIYAEGPHQSQPMVSGFNAAGAWKLERGRPDVAVAILDTGIKWDRASVRTQVRLNRGELPTPAAAGAPCPSQNPDDPYDCDGNGVFDVEDYAGSTVDPAAGPHGAPQIDGEDLIATFSDGSDADGNGFVDDIAGWDFFDNDNNPFDASSYFASANHGMGRAEEAAERGNDGEGGIGVCPHCQLIPLRIWDTFVSDANTFAMGILYATDNGAAVIEGANGSVYHSAFAEQASEYAYEHGVVQTYSGDDLNTANHNYPANYGHAMLIQGAVPDTDGLGEDAGSQFAAGLAGLCDPFEPPFESPPTGCPGTELPVSTYFRGANTTQFGGKSSIAMEGATGSENTGKASGAAALVIAAARNREPPIELRPDETRAILEQTAERATGGATGVDGNVAGAGAPDPGADPSRPREDQWTSHFGWGRVDLGAAVSVARSGEIPPEAAIESPDWYAPVTGSTLAISGLARSRFATGGRFHWRLEWGAGQAPASWNMVDEGDSSTEVTDFGEIDLDEVRAALASFTPPPDPGAPTFSTFAPHPEESEFTVRLVVEGEDVETPGIDRRVLVSAEDASLRPGFPKRLGSGGEAAIRYADLDGDNSQELIVPTEDGAIHAYRPDGSELPGWPVHTMTQLQAEGHDAAPGFAELAGSAPPREPPRGPVVADLDDDGRPELIESAGIHVYVWEPDGTPRPGFPVSVDLGNCDPSLQSQPLSHPKCGLISSPAVARLEGPEEPFDIVVPALDGHLYAFDGDGGEPLPGYPVQLVDPAVPPGEQMIAESINEPAIGDLDEDGVDDVVVATNETYGAEPPSAEDTGGLFGQAFTNLLAGAAGGSSRVYAVDGASGEFLPGWPIELNGAIQNVLPLIGPGQNPAIAEIDGEKTIVASTTGSTVIEQHAVDGSLIRSVQQGAYGAGSDATDRSGTINLFESAAIGRLAPSEPNPAIVKYGMTLGGVANLALVGQNAPYNHLIGAYHSETGEPLPAFPRVTDDFQFLSSSSVAKVRPGDSNQVLAGTGLGLLHAYDGLTGLDVEGFPKVTGGWLYAPAALSEDGRIASITREGFLFEWDEEGLPRCQTEWPAFRHDQQGSGNYDRDGTPPSTPSGLSLDGDALEFSAPGDDGGCGAATRYEVVTSESPIGPAGFVAATPLAGAPEPGTAGSVERFALPAHERYVAVRAVDEAGNIGWMAQLDTTSGSGGGSGDGGGAPATVAGPPRPKRGPCANLLRADRGGKRLFGSISSDLIVGRHGRDRIWALGGDDCVNGRRGRDLLNGGRGADRIKGNGGRDVLVGGPGRDRLLGKIDQDKIHARDGVRDVVRCGRGRRDFAKVDSEDLVRGCERVRRR